jgi:hypothetical protein
LISSIDADIEQRYSEAQIPDLVANANPQVLEANTSPCRALSQTGGLFASGTLNCAFRCSIASNSGGLVFASSSADDDGREARGPAYFNAYSILGGY